MTWPVWMVVDDDVVVVVDVEVAELDVVEVLDDDDVTVE